MDGEGDHLCNRWEAGDWAVVGGVFPIDALVDQHCPSFEEPVVLLVPPFLQSPFNHLLDQLVHRLLDWLAFLDGEGIHAVNTARLPRCCAPEDFVELFFRELFPSTSSSKTFTDSSKHFLDGFILSPPFSDNRVVDGPPELKCFLGIGCVLIASKVGWEAFVFPP